MRNALRLPIQAGHPLDDGLLVAILVFQQFRAKKLTPSPPPLASDMAPVAVFVCLREELVIAGAEKSAKSEGPKIRRANFTRAEREFISLARTDRSRFAQEPAEPILELGRIRLRIPNASTALSHGTPSPPSRPKCHMPRL